MRYFISIYFIFTILVNAQSPFDKFTDESNKINIHTLNEEMTLKIENEDKKGLYSYLLFAPNSNIIMLYDSSDILIKEFVISNLDLKTFSKDPLESNFPHNSPFVFLSGDPINRIDPDGRADYYTRDGTHRGNDGENDNKTMLSSNKPKDADKEWSYFDMATDLKIEHSEFLKFAGAIHIESSGNKEESFAIGTTTINKIKRYKESLAKQFINYYFSSTIHEPGKSTWKNFQKNPTNDKFGISSAINATLYKQGIVDKDLSNGATHWDGRDLLSVGEKHYRYRHHPKNPNKTGISVANNVDLEQYYNNVQNFMPKSTLTPVVTVDNKNSLWHSTATYGHSLFFMEK